MINNTEKVTFNNFQAKCVATAVYPYAKLNTAVGRSYCCHGLVSELCEMFAADTYKDKIKESGDVLWYIAALAQESGIDMLDVFSDAGKSDAAALRPLIIDPSFLPSIALMAVGKIADQLKKNIRDDFTDALGVRAEIIRQNLSVLYTVVISFAFFAIQEDGDQVDSVAELLMTTVIDKLAARKEADTLHGSGDDR